MIIKKYVVNDMNEAMTRIRYELGRDAIIISQRKIRKGGFLGLFSKKSLEVTAAIDNSSRENNSNNNIDNNNMDNNMDNNNIEAIKKMLENKSNNINNAAYLKLVKENSNKDGIHNNIEDNIENNIRMNAAIEKNIELEKNIQPEQKQYSENKENINTEELMKELIDLKKMVKSIGTVEEVNEETIEENNHIRSFLVQQDVEENYIEQILESFKNLEEGIDEKEKLKSVIEDIIDISQNSVSKVTVLVGPTGVGKTTTIAKLAGKLSLMDKKKVGLITIDTYRIGAVEQLKTYADIMNIPFKVVLSIKDMERAIYELDFCDTILVDTTGRSSKNMMQISELRAFVEKIKDRSVHLVISASTKNRDIETIIKGYAPLGYENVIITKLDETTTYGSILKILMESNKSVSFITTGQDVPDDIKEGNKDEIVKLILGEDKLC